MLEELAIKNLGVIREAYLPLGSGLCVITGETGAGKTILLTGLGLLMGKRADAGLVRSGTDGALVEGVWRVEEDSSHAKLIEATGAELEDGAAFVSRSLKPDGKSRSSLCGRSVPAKTLTSVTSNLVSIHGQADQQRLRTPEAQREALDRFGGQALRSAYETYRTAYHEARKLSAKIEDLKKNRASLQREYLQLQSYLEDFNNLDPQEGEVESLETEIDLLSHLDALRDGVGEAGRLLDPETDDAYPPAEAISSALRSLSRLAHHDSNLDVVVEALTAAQEALGDATDALHTYGSGLDENGIERLYAAQERKQVLEAFLRKNRMQLEEALAYADEAAERLKELDPDANDEEALAEKLATLEARVQARGKALTKLRSTAGVKLEAAVNEELAGLAMVGVTLAVGLEACPASPHGLEEVTLRVRQHGSKEPQPISKAASGGELSRIMLALEVVLADPATTPTYVFDEVDSGVGGATAIEIGRRLARLAQDGAQVVVVTHLAQVAAFATTHLKVKKTLEDGAASTSVEVLNEEARVMEIARLLSGLQDSDSGREHAEELLALGAQA